MRPTITIHAWKIALDLPQTKLIQNDNQPPKPDCDCSFCRNWRAACENTIPQELATQLTRLGLNILKPKDLYAYDHEKNGLSYRARFDIAGAILSGPAPKNSHNDDIPIGSHYQTLREAPLLIQIAINQLYPFKKHKESEPKYKNKSAANGKIRLSNNLLEIDIRLFIPWVLDESTPKIFSTPT